VPARLDASPIAEERAANSRPIIRAAGLSKKFQIYPKPWGRLSEWVTFGSVRRHEAFWALRDVSFDIGQGDALGVIGINGSGKSTLLKILTGAMYPTSGTFEVAGRVLSLLELGTGLNPLLSGRQNVVQSAGLLAFAPDYVQRKLPEVEAFAELGEFFDTPIRLYSSGMLVRLAFSLFACLEPDVFVVDEALSVGDVFFQQKCVRRIEEMRARGTTMLFVSHDMQLVRRLCPRVLLLSHGRAEFLGPTDEGVSRYYSLMGPGAAVAWSGGDVEAVPRGGASDTGDLRHHNILPGARSRHGSRGLELVAATFRDDADNQRLSVSQSQSGTLQLLLRAHRDVPEPTAGFHLFDRLGNLVFATGTWQQRIAVSSMRAGDERIVTFHVRFDLQEGEYTLSVGCSEAPRPGAQVTSTEDQHEGIGPLTVHAVAGERPWFYGVARLPVTVNVD
jgi:ABC-type polysaccharide/polyol phosphate transport system ATPase subunit